MFSLKTINIIYLHTVRPSETGSIPPPSSSDELMMVGELFVNNK